MSTETKIGLVIGLGFIVCFAVLLANSGPEQASATQWSHVMDAVGAADHSLKPGAGVDRTSSRSSYRSGVAAQSKRSDGRSTQEQVPSRVEQAARQGLSPSRSMLRHTEAPHTNRYPEPVRSSGRAGQSSERNVQAIPQYSAPRADGSTNSDPTVKRSAAPVETLNYREGLLHVYLDARRESPAPAPPPNVQESAGRTEREHVRESDLNDELPGSQRRPTPIAVPTRKNGSRPLRHTVTAGDTLSKIAAKYYGRRSGKVVTAIFNANRSAMPNPDQLRIGIELTLPTIDGFNPTDRSPVRAEPVPPQRASPPFGAPTPMKQAITWYQIKKNDRYASIAREQLGDASRWPEIFKLNQDRFPNAGRIQWGVRIRLPATRLASAGRP